MCRSIRRRSPSSPNQRSCSQSLSARNRRPSCGWYSVKSRTGVSRSSVRRYSGTRLNADAQVGHAPGEEQRRVEWREQPLVRVDDDRVGAFPAVERCSTLRDQRHGPGIGRIDVEPQPVPLRDVGDRRDGVDRGRRGRPDRGDDGDRQPAGLSIGLDRGVERFRTHGERVIDRDPDEALAADAERHARLLDRAVRLLRGVDADRWDVGPAGQPARRDVQSRRFARRCERDQRRGRRGVGQQAIEPDGQPERPGAASRRRPPRARCRSATSARASGSGRAPRSASRRGCRAPTRSSRSTP